jgi:DNA repair exonuclease SbcCD nuclease subunit
MSVICCISDCHLGYQHRLKKERLEDFEKAFIEAVSKAMEYDPDLLIFGGDLFEHSKPDARSFKVFISTLMNVSAKTIVVLAIGNHELDGHLRTSYQPTLAHLNNNIHVLSTENPHVFLEICGKTVGIHGFEYLREKDASEAALKKLAQETESPGQKADTNILCLHQGIEGSVPRFEITLRTLKEISRKYDLILVGHVHRYQRINGIATPAYYIGSTAKRNFSESENVNGILVFKDFDYANPSFIEIASASMRTIKQDLGTRTPEEINAYLKNLIESNSDVKNLSISLDVEVKGNHFDVTRDWESRYPGFTILEVHVNNKVKDEVIKIEKAQIEPKVIEEYFEKKGMGARKELKEACVRFYERYGG